MTGNAVLADNSYVGKGNAPSVVDLQVSAGVEVSKGKSLFLRLPSVIMHVLQPFCQG